MDKKCFTTLLLFGLVLLFQPTNGFAIIIDTFDYGVVNITTGHFTTPFTRIESVENALPQADTLGGARHTWVSKGMDYNPSTANIENGIMTFGIDNDECYGGLSYSGFGEVNLQNELGIAFDVLYPNMASYGAAISQVQLYDINGERSAAAYIDLANPGEDDFTGHYMIYFDNMVMNNLNLGAINQIDICFSGRYDFAGAFSLDNIYTVSNPVPEPATLILLGAGIMGLVGTGKKRIKK
jgi:hypothetical protein